MLRAELALYSYTLENVAKVVLLLPGDLHQHLVQAGPAILYLRARLFGIQLFEVFSRGSQFRVESSMLRVAKPRNYVSVSPTRQQLGGQAAPEYLALLLEPESRMYTDPVVTSVVGCPALRWGLNEC